MRLFISRHVIFDEQQFPYPYLLSTHSNTLTSPSPCQPSTCPVPIVTLENVIVPTILASPSLPPRTHTPIPSVVSAHSQSIAAPLQASPLFPLALDINVTSSSESHGFILDNLQVVLSIPPLNLHPMQTRNKSGILRKKAFSASIQDLGDANMSLVEPASYKSTVKIPVWLQAMKEEVNALHAQSTWSLVSLPANKNLVGCKWIFKVKRHSDGFIARHNARLVAKGFSQEPGFDYGETFSPVVKPTTVKLVLALAAHFNWSL